MAEAPRQKVESAQELQEIESKEVWLNSLLLQCPLTGHLALLQHPASLVMAVHLRESRTVHTSTVTVPLLFKDHIAS